MEFDIDIEYKYIPDFPGYRAGSNGSIWSCLKYGKRKDDKFSGHWKKLKQTLEPRGRPTVGLYNKGKCKRFISSHIIALLFLGPRPNGLLVLHKNGDQTDNRATNLKYGTHKENTKDMIRHGTGVRGDWHPIAKLNEIKVREIKEKLKFPKRGLINKLSKEYDIDGAVISRIRDGKSWTWVN
jgi:hypothetical protein